MSGSDRNGDAPKQLLHLVFGGELKDLDTLEFADLKALDIVGIYPNYDEAAKAWRGAAQRTVDSAQTRYFVVHMHRLLEPEAGVLPTAKPADKSDAVKRATPASGSKTKAKSAVKGANQSAGAAVGGGKKSAPSSGAGKATPRGAAPKGLKDA